MFNVRGPIGFEAWQLKEKHIHTCIKKDVCSLSFKTRVKNLKFFFLLICQRLGFYGFSFVTV